MNNVGVINYNNIEIQQGFSIINSMKKLLKSNWFWPVCIFILALIIRLYIFFKLRGDFWFQTTLIDDYAYNSWAHKILSGDLLSKFSGKFFLNPGYPYFLALIYKIFGDKQSIIITLQYLIGSFSCVLVYFLGKKVFNNKIVLISGILLGITTLLRPNIFLFLFFVLIWLWVFLKISILQKIKNTLFFLMGLIIILLPMIMRNWIIEKKFTPLPATVSSGINFYIGNNPEAKGTNKPSSFSRPTPEYMIQDFQREAEKRLDKVGLKEEEVSEFWFSESLKWIKKEPFKYLKLLFLKINLFINSYEAPGNFTLEIVKKYTNIFGMPLISWGLIFPLGMAGIVLSLFYIKIRFEYNIIFYLYSIIYLLTSLLFFVLSEYRMPITPILILYGAYFIHSIFEKIKERKIKQIVISFIMLIILLGISNAKIGYKEVPESAHYFMGIILENKGFINEAILEYRKSVESNPMFVQSHINLANIYMKNKKYDIAIRGYETIAKISPEHASASYYRISKIYEQLKDYELSKKYYKKAFKIRLEYKNK